MRIPQAISEADKMVFRKKITKLAQYKGSGTELISVYVPPGTDRSSVTGQLTEEMSQSSNIKSPTTRKNVQGALRKIVNFLKSIDFRLPEQGIVIFAGNISEREGRSDIRLFTIKPVERLDVKLYWCDSEFHLEPLQRMLKTTEIYGILTLDKREATIAILRGKRYDIIGKFTSRVHGKERAGGQSSVRFQRLREEAAQQFFREISEKMGEVFIPMLKELKGVIIAGPGITKEEFLTEGNMDYRVKEKIIGKLDTSYTDEYGIKEVIDRAGEILKDASIVHEKQLIQSFFAEIAKNALAAYGEKEVLEALAIGKVKTLLISDGIEKTMHKFKCEQCGNEQTIQEDKAHEIQKCSSCNFTMESIEEADYMDYFREKADNIAAETEIIGTETDEGKQFLAGFGGIGALLRYK